MNCPLTERTAELWEIRCVARICTVRCNPYTIHQPLHKAGERKGKLRQLMPPIDCFQPLHNSSNPIQGCEVLCNLFQLPIDFSLSRPLVRAAG